MLGAISQADTSEPHAVQTVNNLRSAHRQLPSNFGAPRARAVAAALLRPLRRSAGGPSPARYSPRTRSPARHVTRQAPGLAQARVGNIEKRPPAARRTRRAARTWTPANLHGAEEQPGGARASGARLRCRNGCRGLRAACAAPAVRNRPGHRREASGLVPRWRGCGALGRSLWAAEVWGARWRWTCESTWCGRSAAREWAPGAPCGARGRQEGGVWQSRM